MPGLKILMQKENIHIGIAEDHTIFRKALIPLINHFDFCRIVLEAGNGLELQEEIKKGISPDIILLDLQMPLMNGHETLDWLHKHHPSIQVIILSMYDVDFSITRLMHVGAKAFLKKTVSPEELKNAIYAVKEKGFYYTDNLTRKLFHAFYNDSGTDPDTGNGILNEKEIRFLHLVSTEFTYKEIAREMKLSVRAIDKIRDHMFFKFDVKSRVALAMKVLKEGMTSSLFLADCL
jgi:DNA-binding NarL/FixJ family response regulator